MKNEPSTWALVISSLSLMVSLSGLAWAIAKEFVYPKPQYRVRVFVARIIDLNTPGPGFKVISIKATNFGPTDGKLTGVSVRRRRATKREYGQIHLIDGPPESEQTSVDAGFPDRVAIGETKTGYIQYVPKSAFRRGIYKVGVVDSFGRYHWAPEREVRKIKAALAHDFPEAWAPEALAVLD